MRGRLLLALFGAFALSLSVAYLAGVFDDDAPAPDAAFAEAAPAPAPAPPPAAGLPSEEDPALVHASGTVSGLVRRSGQGVAGATVRLRVASRDLETLSDDVGVFAFKAVPEGDGVLSATLLDEASPVAGPFRIERGGLRTGVILELSAAAHLEGSVVDVLTRRPIPNAALRSSAGSALADGSGRFAIGPLPSGETWVEASADGYLSRVDWVSVGAARTLSGFELALAPSANVRGVVTRLGKPLAGAAVWAESAGLEGRVKSPVAAISDGEGRFALQVEPGNSRLAAAGPGGGGRVEGPSVSVSPGQPLENVRIELGEGLTARGSVMVAERPAAGAQVAVVDARSQRPAGTVVVDGFGNFELPGLAPSNYLVEVRHEAIVAQKGPFGLTGDGDAPWRITLDGGLSVEGRVIPKEQGVQVSLRGADWVGGSFSSTLTDAEGAFRFDGLSAGDWQLHAEGQGGSASKTVRAGSGEVELRLGRAVLRGRVRDERGRPVNEFTVSVAPDDGSPQKRFAQLSAQGEFEIPLAPGGYSVRADSPGKGETPSPLAVTLTRDASDPVELRLEELIDVRGRVLDIQSKENLAGATVIALRVDPKTGFRRERFATAVTGADGRFFLRVPRRVFFTTRKDGYFGGGEPIERCGRDPDGTLTLGMGKTDRVQGPASEPYEGVGMQLDFNQPGRVGIAAVFEGSPAQLGGVRAGDELLSVNGQPLTGLNGAQIIERIMGPSGTVVRLRLKRQDAILDLAVRRRTIEL